MTVKIIRGAEVNRPEPDALPSSVLDHATVVDNAQFGLRNNEGLWPSYNCLDTLVPTPICPDPLMGEGDDFKTFSTAEWVPGFEFAYYGAVQCSAVGLDVADQKSEIRRVFDLNAGKGIEQALLANRFVALTPGPTDPDISWDAPVDLTPGTSVSVAAALSILEGYAATVYAGVPTLHLPRAAVLVAFGLGLLREEGGKFYTKTGSKVAAGGGYDVPLFAGGAPTTGVMDFYATGEVYVERSEEVSIHAYTLPGDGSGVGEGLNGLSDNTSVALAERMFRVAVDCFVAKVSGEVWV